MVQPIDVTAISVRMVERLGKKVIGATDPEENIGPRQEKDMTELSGA